MTYSSKGSKVPTLLQPVLWSIDVNKLDCQRDKNYIIHQIFAYGNIENIRWVFKTYGVEELRKVFCTVPYKDYVSSRFHFVKNILLNLTGLYLNQFHYVKNIPRDIK